MLRNIFTVLATLSLLLSATLWVENQSIKTKINYLYAKQQVDWHLNRADAFNELRGNGLSLRSSRLKANPLAWEWAVTLPDGQESEFIEWMQKKSPPNMITLTVGFPSGAGGGGGVRDKAGDQEGRKEMYYSFNTR